MRLMVEANLEQVIRRQMIEVDSNDVRNVLNERVREVFGKAGCRFSLVPFPAGPYEVPDEVGDGRPFLVVMGYEARRFRPNRKACRRKSPKSSGIRAPTTTCASIATISSSSWPTGAIGRI